MSMSQPSSSNWLLTTCFRSCSRSGRWSPGTLSDWSGPWGNVVLTAFKRTLATHVTDFLFLSRKHLWILKTGLCPVIWTLLQCKLVLVHKIAIRWSVNEWIKVWFTIIDCLCFCLCLWIISKMALGLFWVGYFWSISDQSVTGLCVWVCVCVCVCDDLF